MKSPSLFPALGGTLRTCLFLPVVAGVGLAEANWVRDPESVLPYLVESANFWFDAYDDRDGGFFSEIGLTGQPTQTNQKALLAQTRNAYGFVRAFMVTGDEIYLEQAENALEFLYEHGWDEVNEGWYGLVNRSGNLISHWSNNDKWSFWQHYMLLGTGAYVDATRDPYHLEWLEKGQAINDEKLWDARPGFEGYYQRANLNWSNPRGKGFTPTVDAVTTHGVQHYLITRDPMRLERLRQVSDNIVDHLVGSMDLPQVTVGFLSEFDTDWKPLLNSEITSVGHAIKTAWCLARAYLIFGEDAYRDGAVRILEDIYRKNPQSSRDLWDHEYGAPRGEFNVLTGQVTNFRGDWWTVEQGVTGGLMNYYITRDPRWLEMAEDAMRFFMESYYDHENGEVYAVVNANGTIHDPKKGDMFKAGYHSIEQFYLSWLYSSLFVVNQPVSLYYRFEPTEEARSFSLTPIAHADDMLLMTAVELDGAPFANFDPVERRIELAAGEGGIFRVTFENASVFNRLPHGEGWLYDWMGWIYDYEQPVDWFYHVEHGWIYPFGHDKAGIWFYVLDTDGAGAFYFTGPSVYPSFYSLDAGWVVW